MYKQKTGWLPAQGHPAHKFYAQSLYQEAMRKNYSLTFILRSYYNRVMKRPHQSTFREFDKSIEVKTNGGIWVIVILLTTILLLISNWLVINNKPIVNIQPTPDLVSPHINNKFGETEIIKAATPSAKVDVQSIHTGIASYYSRAGCVGCSPTMTMANGQPLDDSRLTVAFNRSKLNSKVRVTNEKTGESVIAMVTDTGGFEKQKFNVNGVQRIVDLTIATRDAINCSDLCQVKVEVL